MKTKENTNAKENINAVGSNSKSTAPNAVCWLDVILFEDNTFEVEIYYTDVNIYIYHVVLKVKFAYLLMLVLAVVCLMD